VAKSELLRVHEVRAAYRLIGECRDVGNEPSLWYTRMLEGVARLVGASAIAGGEGRWRPARPELQVVSAYDSGMDAIARERYAAFMREQGPQADPCFQQLMRRPGRVVTSTRRDLVPDRVWFNSPLYDEYRRPARADHAVMSICRTGDAGCFCMIGPLRAISERDFSPRETRLLNFFAEELGPLIGRALVSATELGPETLSPRLRQTLACLLEGESEKQIAARLSLSFATTHQYVTTLYRVFGVCSRGQLMAHVLKRMRRPEWSAITPQD
jgi:DNA-binding CsgD family transcriptional regulator